MNHNTLSMRAGSAAESSGEIDTRTILGNLQKRIGPQKFNAWFHHGTSISVVDGSVRVLVANSFVANWIETHYQDDVASVIQKHTGDLLPVIISVDPALSGELRKRQRDNQATIVDRARQGGGRSGAYVQTQMALRHKLKDYVVGESNRLAYSAAQTVLGKGGAPFHPLFIHGMCGVGKTHLLQGICNAMSGMTRDGRPLRWRYITGEQFTNEFVQAVRHKKFPSFRQRYRNLDLLAIDDVHFLASKKAIQEEFLHTFNAIEASGSQVVLASDAHPKMVSELSDQLNNRFMAGMIVKVEMPDHGTRLEVLRRKSAMMNMKVTEDVLEYIAAHIRGSIRELEGTLFKLAARSSLDGGAITMDTARNALSDHLSQTDSVLTLGDIESVVATFFGITPADIHSSRRTKTISVARMSAMYLGRKHTPMSYPEIGRFMGKNHSSVVLAVKRMDKALGEDADLNWNTAVGRKFMPAKQVVKLLDDQIS